MKKRLFKLLASMLAACLLVCGIAVTRASALFYDTGFEDLDDCLWIETYVMRAKELGLFSGTTSTTFSPWKEFTRAEAVTVLGRMHEKITGETIPEVPAPFADITDKYGYCRKYAAWAGDNAIFRGYGQEDRNFRPAQPITHVELMVVFYRYLGYLDISNKYMGQWGDSVSEEHFQLPEWAIQEDWVVARWGVLPAELRPYEKTIREYAVTAFIKLYEKITFPADFETPREYASFYADSMLDDSGDVIQDGYSIFTNYQDFESYIAGLKANSTEWGQPQDMECELELDKADYEENNILVVQVRANGMPGYYFNLAEFNVEDDTANVTLVQGGRTGHTADVKGEVVYLLVPKTVTTCEIERLSWTEDANWIPMSA